MKKKMKVDLSDRDVHIRGRWASVIAGILFIASIAVLIFVDPPTSTPLGAACLIIGSVTGLPLLGLYVFWIEFWKPLPKKYSEM
jgi:hypothetical protein